MAAEKSGRQKQGSDARPPKPIYMALPKTMGDIDLVDWDGPEDPENPMNWTRMKKWRATIATGCMTFCVSFASSVFATATTATAGEFGVGVEVAILGVSLDVLGFACGALVWGPASELYGRTRPLFVAFFIFVIFNIPVAVARNLETILVCRFLMGCFGAAPFAIVGGMYVDFWHTADRAVAICVYAGATFLGPAVGPIVGEFTTRSYLGWRWTAWITLIMAAFCGVIGLLEVPESFAPLLLQRKAQRLRLHTKHWALHSKRDETSTDLDMLFRNYFAKPVVMLVKEPILLIMTVYSSLVYSILYLTLFAYPYSFQVVRGWQTGISSLPFLAILIGIIICCIGLAVDSKTRFRRQLIMSKQFALPEARLPPMIMGSFLLPLGLFWFAWASDASLNWVSQVISGVFIGCGIVLIFLPGLSYIADVYLLNANSALAANAFVRNFAAAGSPLFVLYMYENLGVQWATSLLAFICVAMIPFPIVFFVYGKKFRSWGKYSFDL